mmetsp:Transcript_139240/g.242343  ORF Transcript_139240/g.242343 Transcript_139240/m.242343 type:complete len:202 (-) Transcript_139240:327-932(-)
MVSPAMLSSSSPAVLPAPSPPPDGPSSKDDSIMSKGTSASAAIGSLRSACSLSHRMSQYFGSFSRSAEVPKFENQSSSFTPTAATSIAASLWITCPDHLFTKYRRPQTASLFSRQSLANTLAVSSSPIFQSSSGISSFTVAVSTTLISRRRFPIRSSSLMPSRMTCTGCLVPGSRPFSTGHPDSSINSIHPGGGNCVMPKR